MATKLTKFPAKGGMKQDYKIPTYSMLQVICTRGIRKGLVIRKHRLDANTIVLQMVGDR